MNDKIRRACAEGKTASEGGMNLPELRKYAIGKGLVSRKDAMTYSRREIEEMILNNVEQSGGSREVENMLVYRDVDENGNYVHVENARVIKRKDKDGKLHSTLDRPARIWRIGGKDYLRQWYKHGKLHRKGKPAEIIMYYKRDNHTLYSFFNKRTWYNEGNIIKTVLSELDLEKNGKEETITVKNENGHYHSFDDKPAIINLSKAVVIIDVNGRDAHMPARRITRKVWCKDNLIHREDGPAIIHYNILNKKNAKYYWNLRSHRWGDRFEDVHNGSKKAAISGVEYWKNGKKHRGGGEPAVIKYNELWSSERIESLEYWVNGKRHRSGDKPAVIKYREFEKTRTDHLIAEEYWKNGKKHRSGDKPAVIRYDDKTGKVTNKEYWVNGKRHREGGPASFVYDLRTGELIREEYWMYGRKIKQ